MHRKIEPRPLQANLSARVEELQEALMRKAAEMAESIMDLKQQFADEKDALLESYRCVCDCVCARVTVCT